MGRLEARQWAVLITDPNISTNNPKVRELTTCLMRALRENGTVADQPSTVRGIGRGTIAEAMGELHAAGAPNASDPSKVAPDVQRQTGMPVSGSDVGPCRQMLKLVLVILPNDDKARYGELKRAGDAELGVPTQV